MFRKKQIIEYRTVLFVDDDEAILRSLERGLVDEPYIQLFARSGQEALEILQTEQVHVIVADMRMPGMDGIELLRIVGEKYPHVIKIVLSGYADTPILHTEFKQVEIFEFIHKNTECGKSIELPILHIFQKMSDYGDRY